MTPPHRRVARLFPFALLMLAQAIDGCQTPIEIGASASDADAVIALLHAHHVGASKQATAGVNGTQTFNVLVLDTELASAISALRATSTIRAASAHPSSLDEPSWIPTPTDEELRRNAASSARIEDAIRLWDGVIDVRVQIAPTRSSTRTLGDPDVTPTAAVVIKHRPRHAPTAATIQDLVAHAVERLRPENVAVVMVEARPSTSAALTQLGPIAVTSGSAQTLRLALIVALLLVSAFVTLVAWAWRRTRRETPAA